MRRFHERIWRSSWVLLTLAFGCGNPPEIEFNSPPTPGVVEFADTSPDTRDDLQALLVTAPDDPDGDLLTQRWSYFRNGSQITISGDIISSDLTVKGDVWEARVIAFDGEYESEPFSDEVTVLNAPPEIGSAELTPLEPTTDDDLELALEATDADGDEISFISSWSVDGVVAYDYANQLTVSADHTTKGQVWTVTYAATDGEDQGVETSASVTIGNKLPSISAVNLLPSEPTAASVMQASLIEVHDMDEDPVTTTLTLFVDGSTSEVLTLEGSDTVTSFSHSPIKDQQLWIEAVPNDGHGDGAVVNSSTVVVLNTAPELGSASLDPSTAYEATTLSCSYEEATDVDGDDVSVSYDWLIDSASLGLDQSTLDGGSFDRGDNVSCVVTPDDGEDSGEAITSDAVEIANTPPTFTSVSLTPSDPVVTDTVTATCYGWSDDDGDSESYSYAWEVSGTSVTATDRLGLGPYQRGDTVFVTVTANDGTDDGDVVTSNTITIQNSIPTLSSVSISPSPAYGDDTLTALSHGWSDADGDSPVYGYAWYVNGVLASEAGSSLDSSFFVRDDEVYVEITPSDGIDTGTPVCSSTELIKNTPPVADAEVIDSLPASTCTAVELDASASYDHDGDALDYSWSITSKPSGSLADVDSFDDPYSATPTFWVDAEGSWILGLTVSDGSDIDTISVLLSSGWRAENTAPIADAGSYADQELTVSCGSSGYTITCPLTSTTVSMDAGGSTDDDGDPLGFTWSASVDTPGPSLSFDDENAEQPTLTIDGLESAYASTNTYEVTVTLDVQDCANGSDSATAVFDVAVTGE